MADLRVLAGVKIVDADSPANSVQITASGELTAILAANADVNIGDIGFLAADQEGDDDSIALTLTSLRSIGLMYGSNGANWERIATDGAGSMDVNVTLALPTGGNVIGLVGGDEVDNAAVSVAGSLLMGGLVFDDTTPVVVTEGDAGYQRMSADREAYVVNRDAAGNERGANVTASNELNVLASAQPGVDIGDVDILSVIPGIGNTNLGKAEDVPSAAGDVGVATMAIQDAVLSALGSVDDDYTQLRVNANGALWVETVGAAGGTSATDSDPFTVATDSYTPVGGIFDDAAPGDLIEGDGGAVRMSAVREMYTNIRDGAGGERSANVTAAFELNVIASAQPGVDIGDVDVLSLPTIVTLADEIDNAAVSVGGGLFMNGMVFDDTTPVVVTEGDAGYQRMSADREAYVVNRDAAGNERGANVTASNELNVIASAQPGVDIGDVTILDFGASQTDADDDIVADSQTSLRTINLMYGYDGTQWERIQTDAGGAMDVNVIAGGGESLPTSPVRTTGNSTDTAAASTFTQDGPSSDATTTKVRGFDCAASVPIKAELQEVENGAGTTLLTMFAQAGERLEWRAPHRNFFSKAHPSNGGFDGWRLLLTNLDNENAADLYATLYTED